MKRAAVLIREIAGGEISSEVVDLYPKKPKERQVFLTFEKINSLIGQEISRDTIKSILSSLEIKVNNVTESGLGLTIPFYRVDVEREVDVIEEILRVYGYNNIDFKQKLNASIAVTSKLESHSIQDVIGNMLASQGFYEIMTNSLVSKENLEHLSSVGNPVDMVNPLSMDLSVMRTSMLPSGLDTIAHNLNRQQNRLKLFEFGTTYHKMGASYQEIPHLALFLTGNRSQENWSVDSKSSDFFFLKGVVDSILSRLGLTEVNVKPLEENTIFF